MLKLNRSLLANKSGVYIWASNSFAMFSTFYLFLIVSRNADRQTLSLLAVGTALSGLANQIVDGGLSSFIVRKQLENGQYYSVFRSFLDLKNKRLFIIVFSFLPMIFLRFGFEFTCLLFVLTLLNLVYSNTSIYFQTTLNLKGLSALQIINALGFILCSSSFLFLNERLTKSNILWIPIVSLVPAALFSLKHCKPLGNFKFWKKSSLALEGKNHFSLALVGNLITTHLPLLSLGLISDELTGEYSILQQGMLISVPLSYAFGVYFQGAYLNASTFELKKSLTKIQMIFILCVLFFPLAGLLLAELMSFLYGYRLENLSVILLFSAGGIGILTSILFSLALALGMHAFAPKVAWIQCLIVIFVGVPAANLQNLSLLALCEFVSRLFGILVLNLLILRKLKLLERKELHENV